MVMPRRATATTLGGGLESLTYACTAVVVADLDRAIEGYGRHLGFTECARVRIDGANVALLEGAGTQLEFLQYDDACATDAPQQTRSNNSRRTDFETGFPLGMATSKSPDVALTV